MNKRKKVLLAILILAISLICIKVLSTYDYYRNSLTDVKISDGRIEGGETFYLNKGSYEVELNYESDIDFTVSVVSLDSREVLNKAVAKSDDGYLIIDFDADRTLRGADLLIETDSASNIRINEVYWSSIAPVYSDAVIKVMLIVFLVLIMYWLYEKHNNNLLIIIVTGLCVSMPLISGYLNEGHDLYFHLDRIFNIGMHLSNGNFISRANDAALTSLGAITPILYPELFLYFSGFLVAFGGSVMLSFKVLCIFINICSGLTFYFVLKRMTNDKVAVVGSVIYMLNPYRLNNIFIRAAIGESLAMIFFPIAFYGLYELIQGNYKKGFVWSIIGISSLCQSHMLSLLIFLIFGVAYSAAVLFISKGNLLKDKKRIECIAISAFTTIMINIGFIVPFIRYNSSELVIANSTRTLSTLAASIFRIFSDIYSVHMNVMNNSGMTISLGRGLFLGILLSIALLMSKKEFRYKKFTVWCLAIGFIGIWLSSDLFPWNNVQYFGNLYDLVGIIQFPWRFLTISSVFICAAVAVVLNELYYQGHKTVTIVVLFACILSSYSCMDGYFTVNKKLMDNKSDSYVYTYNVDYYRDTNIVQYTSEIISNRTVFSNNSDAVFEYEFNKDHVIKFSNVNKPTTVELPIYYYKNLYKVTINGVKTDYSCSDLDTVTVQLNAEQPQGVIELTVDNSQFVFTDLISVVSTALFLSFVYKEKKKRI